MNEGFSHNNMIESELQVRLMNLVMGEASDFERDQLQTLMEQRAELAAYYQHLEHLHGLLRDVGEISLDVEESSTDDAWQLPAGKREQLLAVLDGKADSAAVKVFLAGDMKTNGRSRRSRMFVTAAIVTAACLLIALTLNSFQLSQRAVLARRESSAASSIANTVDSSSSMEAEADKTSDLLRGLRLEPGNATQDSRVTRWDVNTDRVAKGKEDTWARGQGLGAANTDLYTYQSAADASAEDSKPDSLEYFGVYGQVAEAATNRGDVNAPTAVGSPVQESVTAVDGGTILLGGIKRYSNGQIEPKDEAESKSKADVDSPVPMTVTPRIIISDGEERVLLGRAADDGPVENPLNDPIERFGFENGRESAGDEKKVQAGQSAEGRETLDKLSVRSVPAGTKEVPIAEPNYEKVPAAVAIGAEANDMLGDVQIEHIEDLDLVIIKGAKGDVQRTLEVIDGIKEQESLAEKDWKQSGAGLPSFAPATVPEATRQEIRARIDVFRESMAKKQQQVAESKSDAKQNASLVEDDFVTKHQVNSAYIVPGHAQTQSSPTWNDDQSAGRGWMFTLPPSPQVASTPRAPIAVERKAVERKQAETIDEQSAATQAFSTFSLHVSDVSFKLAQAALAQGQWPEAAKIRIEEFVNALGYHDPLPADSDKVACRVEQAIHPFLMQRNLLRISMRTAATGRAQSTPLRLTIVLDNSGSMERADRRRAVLQAIQMLTKQLRPTDQVTLISFANTPRLLAEKVVGDQGASLLKLIEKLPSEGGTNIEAALLLAREKALEQRQAGAQNRIVLLTDGAVNLGNANPESLGKLVTQLRDDGIAFDAAGISAADLNDEVLEALTRQGDGRYYLLDSADAVAESFAAQIAGALRPSAQNVKVQVEFNPQRVGRYKLLGFEKHRLKQEDFRNDKVDAAEMAAAEAGVAVYHYEIKPNGNGDVGSVSVRFRDLTTGQMIERRWPIPYDSSTPRLEQAEPTMQLAATAALFAAKLSGGSLADSVDLGQLQQLLAKVSEQYATQPRVVQLRTMVEQAKAIK